MPDVAKQQVNESSRDVALIDLFIEIANKNKEKIALIYGETTFTYQRLLGRVNQFRQLLISKGVQCGDHIGVLMPRSIDLVAVFFATFQIGAVYTPLDKYLNLSRLKFIVEDADCKWVVTDELELGRVICSSNVATTSLLSTSHADTFDPSINTVGKSRFTGPAYLTYTSGSTGKPKGVINQHVGMTSRVLWNQGGYGASSEDILLQLASIGFDMSIWEIWYPLILGGTLVIAQPELHKDISAIIDLLRLNKVTTLYIVPSLLSLLCEQPAFSKLTLRTVIAGGEAVSPSLKKRFKAISTASLYILYGPTEASMSVTHVDCQTEQYSDKTTIGKPLPYIDIFITNQQLDLLPVGEVGEIVLSGCCLSLGYYKRETETAKAFIDLNIHDRKRLCYHTGDYGRYLDDGSIEFLGRRDNQIKLRGYRIELEEIERAALASDGVAEAAVVLRNINERGHLVIYLTCREKAVKKNWINFRKELANILPEYMLPSFCVILDRFPLNANQKIERSRLPLPDPKQRFTMQFASVKKREAVVEGD